MKKLLLTSQGLPLELKEVFLSFLPKPPKETSVAFITTAAYGECKNLTWLNVYRKQLRMYGIKDIEDLDLREKTKKELENILENKDIIFVNGGNTFYLLYWVRKSGFDKILSRLLEQGKIYIGISAGSYLICPSIEHGLWKQKFKDRNKIGLKDFSGLNLIPFLIIAHFEDKYRPHIKKEAKTTKYPIVALNDTQAILVEEKKYKLVGKGKKAFFNGFKEKWL